MKSQKRLKTCGSDHSHLDLSKKNHPHLKHSIHLHSVSKEITPKKVNRGKHAPHSKIKEGSKSKHLRSLISLHGEKETSAATKRKVSKMDFESKIKSKASNFQVLSNCLREFAREERKEGKHPSNEQILHLIKAFNKSEIGPISKELQQLINSILDSIEETICPGEDSRPSSSSSSQPNDLERLDKELIQLRTVGKKLKQELQSKGEKEKARLQRLAEEQEKVISIIDAEDEDSC